MRCGSAASTFRVIFTVLPEFRPLAIPTNFVSLDSSTFCRSKPPDCCLAAIARSGFWEGKDFSRNSPSSAPWPRLKTSSHCEKRRAAVVSGRGTWDQSEQARKTNASFFILILQFRRPRHRFSTLIFRTCIIHSVNLSSIDLNLLVVFEAILDERSLTRAAARVGLSQPGMSNALARLRALLGDPLFMRSARGMAPTARALSLGGPVRAALTQL